MKRSLPPTRASVGNVSEIRLPVLQPDSGNTMSAG
jgi:hypothetical protein